ncbi:MAG: HAD family hydrolase [Vicinamibacterales bacterium]
MHRRVFDLIAFDADDTLWHNERSYRGARRHFHRLLTDAGMELTEEELEACVNRTEVANLEYFGYGVSSFALSLIQTAIEVTGGRVGGRELCGLIDLARRMLTEEVELFANAGEAVAALADAYPLMLVTKGDLLHQTSKLERSGLKDHFSFVEVVSHKTPGVYSTILARRGVDPARFLMVGNSLKSDVLPVVEAGGWAVHVPATLSWAHEDAQPPASARHRYVELPTLAELPPFVEKLEREAEHGRLSLTLS